jgi:ion channel-forming bestrophin family protein
VSVNKQSNWLAMAFQLEGSVITTILPRIIFFTVFATIVCLLSFLGERPQFFSHIGNLNNNVIYNLVLGLLLVFRTNTSYERFWEGRKSLGMLVVNIRNLARFICLIIPEQNSEEREQKAAIFKLLTAFAVATKLQLREETANEELKALLNSKQAVEIDSAKRMSLQISLWIGEYFQQQFKLKKIDTSERIEMNNLLNNMVEGLSSCERIAQTPLPIAYCIYLKRLILIYCLGLPFNLVENMEWWAIPVVAIVSFILLGIEELGNELENPFQYDANDLPVNALCNNIVVDVESIANFSEAKFSSLLQDDNKN